MKNKNKMGMLVLVLALGIMVTLSGCSDDKSPSGAAVLNTESKPAVFSIPLSDISEEAKFYEYDSDGETVKFFAVKASDGTIKTAFDACDVCGYAKKGYRQEGKNMVCNNCGNEYPIDGIGTENKQPGGCWPGYLPSKTEGDKLVIQNSDLGIEPSDLCTISESDC